MSNLTKKRQALRSQLSRLLNEANGLLGGTGQIATEVAEVLIERLLTFQRQLNGVDAQIEESGVEQDEQDYARICEYDDKVVTCITKLKYKGSQVQRMIPPPAMTERRSVKVKLPRLELLKFDGKQKNWNSFWEQFDRLVHRNEDLSLSDKFSYLKSLLTGDAAAAIAGLHVSAECYKDAVELLQQRFGADTAIIQEHMEALLNIRPIQSSEDVHELRKLHDRLRAHMRGLNVLGVAEDSYCSLLYPVLLRSLPKDLVLQYSRKTAVNFTQDGTNSSSINETGDNANSRTSDSAVTKYRKKVADLLQLLGIEVESRERLASVQKTDNGGHPKGVTHKKQARQNAASAAALQHVAGRPSCLFCESRKHGTEDCDADLGLTKKKEILKLEGRCYRCTRPYHQSKACKRKIRCQRCSGRHASSVCDPGYQPREPRKDSGETEDSVKSSSAPVSLHSAAGSKEHTTVLLQTAAACVAGRRATSLARIIFDGGSQRSFITKRMSRKLGCKFLAEEELTVEVFGGRLSERTFRRVLLTLESRTKGNFSVEVLETDNICEQFLPRVSTDIKGKLENLGLLVADVPSGVAREISVLIGCDYYWEFVSGKVLSLGKGLRATETAFGWCVQGPVTGDGAVVHCNKTIVLRTAVQESHLENIVSKFWELESIGVAINSLGDHEGSTDGIFLTSFKADIVQGYSKESG
ncbi:uncharacterized protein LOC135392227 [Ornithodoros turicata]|uniref:uncharacterized protein LOC135392227 n=1 Tax=Ornithodoros turicata TaxID=34597 RepID=UPI00313946A9